MALTDAQKLETALHFGLCRWAHPVGCEPYVFWYADRITAAFDHIESAATAPLLERIAHLEATASANYGRGQADAHSMLSERIAELERELAEARKDAELYQFIASACEVFHDGNEIGDASELRAAMKGKT